MSESESVLLTVPAHFDGQEIKLDVGIDLKPGTRLLVIILDDFSMHDSLVQGAMRASQAAFAQVWDNEDDAVYDSL